MLSTADIDAEIIGVLRALEQDYQTNGRRWLCPSNPIDPDVPGSGNIIASEALLCFLLPLAMADTADLSAKIYGIVTKAELQKRVEAHLLSLTTRDDFTGHPYLRMIDAEQQSHPFLDSYSFVISILLLYGRIFGKPSSEATAKRFGAVLQDALTFMFKCAIKGNGPEARYSGYFITDVHLPDAPYKYPTWMAIDTLSDLDSFADAELVPFAASRTTRDTIEKLRKVHADIRAEYKRIYVDNGLSPAEKDRIKGRNVDIAKDIIREDEGDNSPHYNLWATIILLYLGFDDTSTLASAFQVLRPHIDEPNKLRAVLRTPCEITFFSDEFPPGEDEDNTLSDRCFLPQFVKGLSMMLRVLPQMRANADLTSSLERATTELLKNRTAGVALWDRFAENGSQYAIYQTERTVEALCSLRRLAVDMAPKVVAPVETAVVAGGAVDAILRHAIQINIDGKDARELVGREVEAAVADLRGELAKLVAGEVQTALAAARSELEASLVKDIDARVAAAMKANEEQEMSRSRAIGVMVNKLDKK